MLYGNIDGLVKCIDSVVFDYTVTGSPVSSIDTGNILNGDEDCFYTVFAFHVYDTSTSTLNCYFNADNTAGNYGYRGITANNTTVANINSTSALLRLCSVASGTPQGFSMFNMYAKQGSVRLLNGYNVCDINGTTVTQLEALSSVWNNTNTNITGMVFAPSAGKCGVGTRIIIIKGNGFTDGIKTGVINTSGIKNAWIRHDSHTLASPASSVSFTGLDGDSDVLYLGKGTMKNAYNGAVTVGLRANADSGNNYGFQRLSGVNTTVSGERDTSEAQMTFAGLDAQNKFSQFSFLLFAPKGFIRPAILEQSYDTATTTIGGITYRGFSWSNTADNITALSLVSNQSSFLGNFELYKLNI
jgi:hypothetical protein